jgi:hypothetical protein
MIVVMREEGKRFLGMHTAGDDHGEISTRHVQHVILVLDREIRRLFVPLWIAGFRGELCL